MAIEVIAEEWVVVGLIGDHLGPVVDHGAGVLVNIHLTRASVLSIWARDAVGDHGHPSKVA